MNAKIFPSSYDQRRVRFVDALKLTHSGVVVGKSADGRWYFVRSENPNVPPAEWHFKVGAAALDVVMLPN